MNLLLTLSIFVFSFTLLAQETPQNIEEFKVAIINFKDPPLKKQPSISPSLQRYLDNIQKSASHLPMHTDSQKDMKPLYDCIQSYGSFRVEDTLNFVNMCKEQWKAITSDQKAYLRSKNIVSPDEFLNATQDEEKAKFLELENANRPDEMIVMNDYFALKETTPEQLINLQEVDPEIKKVSKDVQQILIKMHTSSDPETVAEKFNASKETDELIRLTQMISQIGNKRGECWLDGSIVKNPDDKILKSSNAERFIIGMTGNEDITKLESYKFSQDGKTYYLYRLNDGLLNEQSWVMAHVDENGEMTFRYFQLVKDQENKIKMATEHDINILKGKLQKTTFDINQNKLYLQVQTGLSVKGSRSHLPLIGTAILPQNEIVIGKVHAGYISKKILIQNDLSVNYNQVSLMTETSPAKNNIWSLGTGVDYNPLNGNIRLSGNVRVYDLVVGYSNGLDGKQSGKVSYVLDRNFLSLNSDFKSVNASLGQSLPKGKGLIMGTTNFKNLHEVKVIIYIQ